MLILYNGRGQLGRALKGCEWTVYHTWNFVDKREGVQRREFNKFKKFLNKQRGPVVFISTKCLNLTPYVIWKRRAEILLKNRKVGDYRIVRLPNLLGKGICEKLKNNECSPRGQIELMTVEDAVEWIRFALDNCAKEVDATGTVIPAKLLQELLRF